VAISIVTSLISVLLSPVCPLMIAAKRRNRFRIDIHHLRLKASMGESTWPGFWQFQATLWQLPAMTCRITCR
jgi:hypothetical protein